MPENSEIEIALKDLANLSSKIEQVHRIYNILWNERVDIYYKIIVEIKKGRGFIKKVIPNIATDFDSEISRLSTINKRERRVLNILNENKEQIVIIETKVFSRMQQIKINNKTLYELSDPQKLESLNKLVSYYLNSFYSYHQNFIEIEANFLNDPNINNLRTTYKEIINLNKQISILQEYYVKRESSYNNLTNIQSSLNNLYNSIENGIKDNNDSKITKLLKRAKEKIKPFLLNKQLYGTFPQRVALNLSDFPKIIISIGIRMAIIAPLLFEATNYILGYKPSLKIVPFKEHPQFYIDIYLFIISYIAYILDVIPGLAKYTIEGPISLINRVQSKLGTNLPF